MLKRWVVSPLTNIEKIVERQDCVSNLINNSFLLDKLESRLSKMPDLERSLSRLYTYATRSSVKAVYIDLAAV